MKTDNESNSTVEGTLAAFRTIMNNLPEEIVVTVLASATREQVNKACHEAAFAHFGKEGEGSIHLVGLRPLSTDGINNTFTLSAELRMPAR